MMELIEALYNYIADEVFGTKVFQYQEHEIDVSIPWTR